MLNRMPVKRLKRRNSGDLSADANRSATVLVQREMESRAFSVSEYNVIFGEPVWGDISQRTGAWWNRRRLKL